MGYYRRRYRNYYRPHYYRGRRYSSSDSNNPSALFIFLGFLVLGFIAKVAEFSQTTEGKVVITILVVVVICFIWKKFKKKPADFGAQDVAQNGLLRREDVAMINSEKHGCKCYMEHLTAGEQEIADLLSRELNYKDYFIFNNLTIPSAYNGSSQIDHLVVSRFGIFVIESKDYSGWIFGSQNDEKWTQSLASGNSKFQFNNPIRQNWSHIKALQGLLPFIPAEVFRSIVVFSGTCEIKTPPIENVVKQGGLIDCIKKVGESGISEEQLHKVIGKLSYVCQTADITPSQHIENINSHRALK